MRFYSLEKLINLHDDYRKVFKIDQHHLMLLQMDGQLHLIESQCPHAGHPLVSADVSGNSIQCSLHGYVFRVESGALLKATKAPCRGLTVYDVVYQQTEVGVML